VSSLWLVTLAPGVAIRAQVAPPSEERSILKPSSLPLLSLQLSLIGLPVLLPLFALRFEGAAGAVLVVAGRRR
jgi:hypothetical protein